MIRDPMYQELAERVSDNLQGMGTFQSIDCTDQFAQVSIEHSGGVLFGENAVIRAAPDMHGPKFFLEDRVLSASRTSRLRAAVWMPDGVHMIHPGLLSEWSTKRQITDEGLVAAGQREGLQNNELWFMQVENNPATDTLVEQLARHRIAAGLGVISTDAVVSTGYELLRELAVQADGSATAIDAAELFMTENRAIPHRVHVPTIMRAAGAIGVQIASEHDIACVTNGTLGTITGPDNVGAIADAFHVEGSPGNVFSLLENDTEAQSGARIFTAVGRVFTPAEEGAIMSQGDFVRLQRQATYGRAHDAPHHALPGSLPHGTLYRGNLSLREHDFDYRLYVPLSDAPALPPASATT